MKSFVKLVNFEINRFAKIYWSLVAITILSQFTSVFLTVHRYITQTNETMYHQSLPKLAYVKQYGSIGFIDCFGSIWFMGPIALCAAAMVFYIFLIWYRDWYGKHTFIYRLFMLPVERWNLYLAKAASILLMVLGFVAVQIILLPVEHFFFNAITPRIYRMDMTVADAVLSFPYFNLLLPGAAIDFLFHYGLGFTVVLVIFTAILLERSFRMKGILLGLLYGFLSFVLFWTPDFLFEVLLPGVLHQQELLWIEVATTAIIAGYSILLGGYLIKYKVTV
ncbi:hypothetical protein [Heyndrickxia coagulans]|uniref:hypothetical protein n=1 Tax=Heyndrickxia coagulans TaxID=1398 RepID=UPI000211059B|nr:hypothetical protein [Heyndrickxia coagulans]AEH54879.1 conserved hypothetical protein [Heyndrickxia coagulans 2-6]